MKYTGDVCKSFGSPELGNFRAQLFTCLDSATAYSGREIDSVEDKIAGGSDGRGGRRNIAPIAAPLIGGGIAIALSSRAS